MSSEQTAAAEGTVGELRRDPFAMLPFCGYNMADYWGHWLELGQQLGDKAPKIFQVNWFRKDADGSFLWPGFGENSRVLEWIARRVDDHTEADAVAVGKIPAPGSLNVQGIDVTNAQLEKLFEIDKDMWMSECDLTEEYFEQFGERVPDQLIDQLAQLRDRLTRT